MVLVVLATLLASLVVPAAPAAAYSVPCWPLEATPGEFESRLHEMMNEHRVASGLAPLARHDGIVGTSRTWAGTLAATGTLAHDVRYSSAIAAATAHSGRAGENLARARSADRALQLFLGSGTHRQVLEGTSWTAAGVGVGYRGTEAFIVVRFSDVPVPTSAVVPRGAAWSSACRFAVEPGRPSAVARLYEAYLDRPPERAGLEWWVTAIERGASLDEVAGAVAASSELVARTGLLDDDAFVRFVYASVLGRQPDPGGLAHWTTMLAQGRSRGWVMASFSESAEYRAHSAYGG